MPMIIERRAAIGVLCLALSLSSSPHGQVESFTTLPLPITTATYPRSTKQYHDDFCEESLRSRGSCSTDGNSLTRLWLGEPQPSKGTPASRQRRRRRPTAATPASSSKTRSAGVQKLQAVAPGTVLERPSVTKNDIRTNGGGSTLPNMNPKETDGRQNPSDSIRGKNKKKSQTLPLYRSMYTQHEILTKEREQEYARALKRAQTIQKRLSELAYENVLDDDDNNMASVLHEPIAPKKKMGRGRPRNRGTKKALVPAYNPFERRINREAFNIDEEYDEMEMQELQHLSIYGVEQLEAKPVANWDHELVDSDYNDDDDDTYDGQYLDQNNDKDLSAFIPTIPDTRRRRDRSKRGQKDLDWELIKKDRETVADMLETLPDAQVNEALQLQGGRLELRSIIMEGALARDALIRNNIRLVVSIAKKWCRQNARRGGEDLVSNVNPFVGGWGRPSLDEVIQEGIIGLSKAADRFEPKRNLRFTTYATFWITSYVRRCFQKAITSGVRVPQGFHETRSRFKALVKSYHEEGKDIPPLSDLARQMGLKTSRLEWILHATKSSLSIDGPLYGQTMTMAGKAGNEVADQQALADILVDDQPSPVEQVELSLLRQSLENAMASELVPYERDILRLRLGLDDGVSRTVPQIVEEYGGALTSSEIRTAEKRAYQKLRAREMTYKLSAYFDFIGIDEQESLAITTR